MGFSYIDQFLDDNIRVLDLIHEDLRKVGSEKGRGAAYSSEQVLRMIIVMIIEHLSYRDTIIRVAESDFLRNFTRIGMGKVMGYALLCDAFKSISESTWNYINDLVKTQATEKQHITPECLRLDSTVCETNIHFPTDASLLWDTYRTLARLIRQYNKEAPEWNMGNRFHDKKIKKLYTYIATHVGRKNKSTKRKVNKFIIILIQRVADLCETTKRYVDHAKVTPTLSQAAAEMLKQLDHFRGLGCKVVDQSQRMYINGEKVLASERIFSIFEEHTELLKRGKAQKPVEFGHMVTIGQTKEKFISFYDVREKSFHDTEIKDIALQESQSIL